LNEKHISATTAASSRFLAFFDECGDHSLEKIDRDFPLFVLALVLTWLYEKTDCLLAPIAAHSLFNTVNLVILFTQNR